MKPIIFWIEKAFWRPYGEGDYEALNLRRGRLRVMVPESIAYLYIEDAAQMSTIHDAWDGGKGQIQLQIVLKDVGQPQFVSGTPKPETPPYERPPYHLKLAFDAEFLSVPLEAG